MMGEGAAQVFHLMKAVMGLSVLALVEQFAAYQSVDPGGLG